MAKKSKAKKPKQILKDEGGTYDHFSQIVSEINYYPSSLEPIKEETVREQKLVSDVRFVNLAIPPKYVGDTLPDPRLIEIRGVTVEELTETPSAPIFSPIDIPGRSSPLQIYSGGDARTLSFTLKLHRDLFADVTHVVDPGASGREAIDMNAHIDFAPTIEADYSSIISEEETTYGTDTYDVIDEENSYEEKRTFYYAKSKDADGNKYGNLGTQNFTVDVVKKNGKVKTKKSKKKKLKTDVTEITHVTKDITNKFLRKRAQIDRASVMLRDLVNKFKAMNYPIYDRNGIIAPKVYCQIGGDIKIVGYPQITVNYKRPVDASGRYMVVDLNITITEVLESSFASTDVWDNMNVYYGDGSPKLGTVTQYADRQDLGISTIGKDINNIISRNNTK